MGASITDCDSQVNTVDVGPKITMREPFSAMDKQTLGARIVKVRKSLEIKQDDLAARLGFATTSRLGNYESGRSFPQVPELKKIAAALGLTVDQLLADDEGAIPLPSPVPGKVPGHESIGAHIPFAVEPGLQPIFLPEAILRRRLPQTDLGQVRWLPNPTTAMSPRIPQGAALLIDVSQTSLDRVLAGETYVIRLWGQRPDVRRIFIFGNNEFRLTGDNEADRRHDLTGEDYKDLEIGGRVIDAI